METLARSWQLTKLTFGVIRQDLELLVFPVLSVIFSGLFVVAVMWPLIQLGETAVNTEDPFFYVQCFVVYFGLAFVATFFNTCVVHTARVRFQGGNAGLGESIGFAFSRIHLIFGWSLVSASVGVILRLIDAAAERAGPVGAAILYALNLILGLTWSVVTIFVLPAMVYHDLGPIDAIKHSSRALKETWGETLILQMGLGLMQFLFMILGMLAFVVLLTVIGTGPEMWILIGGATFYFVLVGVAFNLAGTIFTTALFVYADTGELPGGFDENLMSNAIGSRG